MDGDGKKDRAARERFPAGETEPGRHQLGRDTGTQGLMTTQKSHPGGKLKPGFLRFASSAHQ